MHVRAAIGRFGEDAAARFLQDHGLQVIDRNWRCPEGELDIVARDGDCLVVVEVKTRSSSAFGSPVEAVGHAKAARLRRLAVRWIDAHRTPAQADQAAQADWWAAVRIDVVGVVREPSGLHIEHVVGAV